MDNNSPEGRALSQTSIPPFPTDPDYVPCHKFDPRYPWDPIIPSDEEMEADAKMEQDMILARKPREKLARAQGKKDTPPLALKGESVRPVAPPGPGGLPMRLARVADTGGERSSSSGTRRLSPSALGSRSVWGRDRYTPSPVSIPSFSSVSVLSMPARVPPLPSRSLGASAAASSAHIPPPIRHKLVDSAPAPVVKGKDGSTADTLYTKTPLPVAPAASSPIHRPSEDVGKPACSPLTSLSPQVLPSPTHSQAASPTPSFSSLPPGQADKHAYVSNANSLSKPASGRGLNPPTLNAVADHQLTGQGEDEDRKRELSRPGRYPPEWAGVAIEAERAPKGLPHPQAAMDSPHKYPPAMVGGSHRRASGPESSRGSPGSACDNSRVTRSRSRDGASGSILFADARSQQHRPNSLLEAHFPGHSSSECCKELRATASPNLSRTPSEPGQQQWNNRTQKQVRDRRVILPRARSASPVALPTAPRSWNPGGEPNSLRVIYPRHPYPVRDTQEATLIRPTTSSDSQSTGAHDSTSGTQIGRGQWSYPITPSAPTAAHHAQPPLNTVRSASSSPPYSPPLEMSATPSTKSATSDRRPRMPSKSSSYEPPETFVRSDHSTPSYHPPSEGYGHTSPSPPPQPPRQDQSNRQSMEPPCRPDQSGPSLAGSEPGLGSGGVRVRGIASGIDARARAQAQTSVRAQAPNYRGLEQRIGGGNAMARLAVSRAYSRRPRRISRFATKGRAPSPPHTRRH